MTQRITPEIFSAKVFKAHIITLSDRASKGIYEDRSGPAVKECLEVQFKTLNWNVSMKSSIIPDDADALKELLSNSLANHYDIVITTGGTGIGPRDITPDVLKQYIEKEIPGIMEMIRMRFGSEKPAALVSRAIAGVSGQTLLFAIPGSVKAVSEYMDEINKHVQHLFYMLYDVDVH